MTKPGANAVCVDTETTGLDPEKDRIIELGMVVIRNRKLEASWCERINPGEKSLKAMTEEAIAVHQIERDMLKNEASFEQRWKEACVWIETNAQNLPVIAHNAEFDANILRRELERIEQDTHAWADTGKWVDTWQKSREEFGDSGGSHGLDGLAKRLNIPRRTQGSAHSALGDAELLGKCWCRWGTPKAGDLFDDETTQTDETQNMAKIVRWPREEKSYEKWQGFWNETFR